MTQATLLWSLWQALAHTLRPPLLTAGGFRRFVEWVTGLALNVEEHTITQSVSRALALRRLERPGKFCRGAMAHWRGGGIWPAWRGGPGRPWYGYHVHAGDNTKVHRGSHDVWGTCTFHEYTARCPNRARPCVPTTGWCWASWFRERRRPAWFLPRAGLLYFRNSSCLNGLTTPDEANSFGPKTNWRWNCCATRPGGPGRHLGVFDGGFALGNVVRPLAPRRPTAHRV